MAKPRKGRVGDVCEAYQDSIYDFCNVRAAAQGVNEQKCETRVSVSRSRSALCNRVRKRNHCFTRPFAHQLSSLTVNAPSAHCPPSLNELSLIARLQLFYIQLFHIQLSRVKSLSVQKTPAITAHHFISTRKRPSIPAAR